MNIKRGLKRLLVMVTVLWVTFFGIFYFFTNQNFSSEDKMVIFSVPIGFWILLYMGFWVSSGFTNDKKKDETNE
jgi:hypothetical protein